MKKIIIISVLAILILVGVGVTYSMYTSASSTSTDISLAAFVVNAEKKEQINIPLSNMKPGDNLEYEFGISNNSNSKRSEVNIKYNIVIKTMHFMPLEIELYDADDELILSCDEETERNEENELECISEDIIMPYEEDKEDDYTLKIVFPVEYNSSEYSSLVDYINLEINSSQKIDTE